LSIHTYDGHASSVGKILSKNARIFVRDSDLANLAQTMTTPHGAQIVSTQ
jgi:hypothetical protein